MSLRAPASARPFSVSDYRVQYRYCIVLYFTAYIYNERALGLYYLPGDRHPPPNVRASRTGMASKDNEAVSGISEADVRKAVQDLHAHGDNLGPRQFRATLEEQLGVTLKSYKDLIQDEIALLNQARPVRLADPTAVEPYSKYAFSLSANNDDRGSSSSSSSSCNNNNNSTNDKDNNNNKSITTYTGRKASSSNHKSRKFINRRGSTFRTLSVGIQDMLISEKHNKYFVSHHDHYHRRSGYCCRLGVSMFKLLSFLECLQALALVHVVWPTAHTSATTLLSNNTGNASTVKLSASIALGDKILSLLNLWDIWRLLSHASSLDLFFESAPIAGVVAIASVVALCLWSFPLFVFCRMRRRHLHLRNIARRLASFHQEIEEGRREMTTSTRGKDNRETLKRAVLEKQVQKDILTHEAETNGSLGATGICIAFFVILATYVLQIPGSFLAARLLLCGLGQPGLTGCVGTANAPAPGLFVALFILVTAPLVAFPFASFMIVHRVAPRIPCNDAVFGASSGFLRQHAEIKYDDILYHDPHQTRNPFRVLYLTNTRTFNQERAVSAVVKITAVFCAFHMPALVSRQLALLVAFSAVATVNMVFRGMHREATIERIIISAMTVGILLCVFAIMDEADGPSNFARLAGITFFMHLAVVLGMVLRVGQVRLAPAVLLF